MNKIWMAAGAAALAIAMPASADPGHGKGGHGQQGHGNKGNQGNQNKGGGHGAHAEVKVRAAPGIKVHGNGNAHVEAKHFDDRRGGPDRVVRVNGFDRREGPQVVRVADRGFYDGCPPGLAKKGNGCMPPGQAKKVGTPFAAALAGAALTGPYRDWYRDDDRYIYRMGDDVLYRVNRSNNLIDALIPYGMNDYSYYPVGYSYPGMYNAYNVPLPYQSYYPDGGDYMYRYGGNAIYAVDPKTQLVSSIVSLLAGDLSVGQRLPTAYNVYNVPVSYRDRYYDTPNDWYRYNDGNIYRVDPTTQLITAVISAIV